MTAKASLHTAYLVLGILGKVVQRGDMQLEFAALGELPKASPEAYEIWSCDGDCEAHR